MAIEDDNKDVMIQVRLPKNLRDEFKKQVEKEDKTQAKVMRRLIEKYVEDNRKKMMIDPIVLLNKKGEIEKDKEKWFQEQQDKGLV